MLVTCQFAHLFVVHKFTCPPFPCPRARVVVTLAALAVQVDSNRMVTARSCTCVAKALGKCKHVAGVVYYINNHSTESKTSRLQSWGKPNVTTAAAKAKYSEYTTIASLWPEKSMPVEEQAPTTLSKAYQDNDERCAYETESSKTNGMQPNAATNNNVMGMFAPARPTSTSVNNFFASFNSKDVHKVSPDTIKPGGAPVFVPQTTMEGLNSEVAKLFAWVAEINKKVDQMAADGKVAKLSREKLLALRLQPSAKLRPEYLPKVEMGGRS
ncbi:hypothetical protein B566_EDAN016432 [Ephemera danica]|nr:hypothetical protein B566_EDAN016432 [Ephemera danica]